ncbi:MAG: hypothetical protein WBE86_07295 [Candidatus Acidiferrales bacterium]
MRNPPPFRLGKKPPRIDARTLQLSKYLRLLDAASQQGTARPGGLAPAPPSIDWTAKISSWPMMANDTLGDCTCAAAGHMIECWTANIGDAFTPTNAQIIAAYSAIGNYVPGDPATDNGAVELDVLNYWRQQGIAGHKIDAYASLDPHDQECAKQVISLFGGVYIGLALPLSAQQQDVWDVPSLWSRLRGQSAPGSWGGHAVPVLAYDSDGLTCITWGAKKRMTWAFFAQYCDEAYAPLSHDWFSTQGIDPSGIDFAALSADLRQLA